MTKQPFMLPLRKKILFFVFFIILFFVGSDWMVLRLDGIEISLLGIKTAQPRLYE